ncbi:hypothetical protein OCC_09973 [Thermococcus litoralis DSM 5473]|uniref:MHD domain-containing protein n=2 Tax=Thermococcus litoralis TaxID=2265 RepID=H3ZLF7_THELN|nr:hypothetical protein OCC_09973 [Thermococcus litoralis DSM 5473]
MMRKLTLILIAILIGSVLQVPLSLAVEVPQSSIDLELDGKEVVLEWGKYEIKIKYEDEFLEYKISGIKAIKTVPSGTKVCVVYEDPDDKKVYTDRLKHGDDCKGSDVMFWIQAYYSTYTKKMYVTLGSPLTEKQEVSMEEKDSETLQHSVKIRVDEIDEDDKKVTVEVTMPDGQKVKKTLEDDDYEEFDVKIGDYKYKDFMRLLVTDVGSKDVDFEVLFPSYPVLTLKVESVEAETSSSETTQEATELVYNDILYEGEILTINSNGTAMYKLKLNSVGYYSSFSLFDKNNKPVKAFKVKEGASYQVSEVPLRVEIPPNTVDLEYKRIQLRIYAPQGFEIPSLIREAEIKIGLSVNTNKVLLDGDEIIVFINVENQGRGKAFDVKVVAPIPSGFELKSNVGSWNLKTLYSFTEMPVLVYALNPTQIGTYKLEPAVVTYYNEAGEKKVVKSNTINQIIVYGLPKLSLSGEAFNGTWSTYVHTQEKTVKLKFTVSAEGKDAKYEFIKNATIKLLLPDSLDGETELFVGDLKAGETKTLESEYAILKPDNAIISAMLVYQDPLGKWHEENFGNLVVVNSLPPAVEIKEVKVYPSPEELPQYVNSTLAKLDNKAREVLAEKLNNITISYLPPSEKGINWWPILAILFLIASAVLAYNYMDLKSKYEKALKELGRRERRPGGLPKKEETLKVEEKAVEETQT